MSQCEALHPRFIMRCHLDAGHAGEHAHEGQSHVRTTWPTSIPLSAAGEVPRELAGSDLEALEEYERLGIGICLESNGTAYGIFNGGWAHERLRRIIAREKSLDGQPHHPDCYATKGHHACAVREVERLRAGNEAVRQSSQDPNAQDAMTEGLPTLAIFTPTQRKVLELAATGYSIERIGGLANISPWTVRRHLSNAILRLPAHFYPQLAGGVNSRARLLMFYAIATADDQYSLVA